MPGFWPGLSPLEIILRRLAQASNSVEWSKIASVPIAERHAAAWRAKVELLRAHCVAHGHTPPRGAGRTGRGRRRRATTR
jgi:hypothetical protein